MINLRKNLLNSLAGLQAAWADNSFKAELVLGIVLIPLVASNASVDFLAKMVVIATYLLLLGFELINTAIERLCDQVTRDYNLNIKRIKDMSSAAVFLILLVFLLEVIIVMAGIQKL